MGCCSCRCCCGWFWAYIKFCILIWWGFRCNSTGTWTKYINWPYECDSRQPIGGNVSGIKYIVAGMAKTGTRTMARSIYQAGIEQSYHSEETLVHVWHKLSEDFWAKRVNHERVPSHPWSRTEDDLEVLRQLPSEELAAAISRCGVESMAFDGIENLIWPVYDVSPGAKVILLSWRTYDEFFHSKTEFSFDFVFSVTFLSMFRAQMKALPWGIVLKWVDPLYGRPLEKLLRTGGPPLLQVHPPPVKLFMYDVAIFRLWSHWFSGLMLRVTNKKAYENFFEEFRRKVPKERLMEWDMKKHGWEDLCKFIDGPKCKGKKGRLPRAINVLCLERDFPVSSTISWTIMAGIAYINWKVMHLLFFCIYWTVMLLTGQVNLLQVLKGKQKKKTE